VASFVRDDRVPQMAGAEDVVAAVELREGTEYCPESRLPSRRPDIEAGSKVAPMPIVHIDALRQDDAVDFDAVLRAVCRAVSAFLGEDPQGTWATWRTLERYVEGTDETPTVQPRTTHPPLVRLVAFEGRPAEQIADLLRCVAATLARELCLEPGNVFVTHVEARRGRLFTGGEVVS
jgi:phenylpyruvate tautomerase PptA (4-oxalocrotonate tautomerase family)